MELLWTLGFAVLSAAVPFFNLEAFLLILYHQNPDESPLLLAMAGSLGQNVGKMVWYYAGANALELPLLRRRTRGQKWAARQAVWRERMADRPVVEAVVIFTSALVGIPPFAIISVVAGALRTNIVTFLVAGFVGRTLLLWALLLGLDLIGI